MDGHGFRRNFPEGFPSFPVRTLGVKPASKIADLARDTGIETVNQFFSSQTVEEIRRTHGPARLINAAGVFFHIDNLDDFVLGFRNLLANNGVFVVQAIYLVDMIERNSFDNVYHEHVCHYSVKPLQILFDRFGPEIFHFHRADIHGSSIIVYVGRQGRFANTGGTERLMSEERQKGLHNFRRFETGFRFSSSGDDSCCCRRCRRE
jgi:hypothetical protein